MRETKPTPFVLRAAMALVIGSALVTGWLKPIYREFVGRVYEPYWWGHLHLISLAALIFLFFLLWKRNWKLSMLTLCAFLVSIVPDCIPDYVVAAA
jgi:hypothetical protein